MYESSGEGEEVKRLKVDENSKGAEKVTCGSADENEG